MSVKQDDTGRIHSRRQLEMDLVQPRAVRQLPVRSQNIAAQWNAIGVAEAMRRYPDPNYAGIRDTDFLPILDPYKS